MNPGRITMIPVDFLIFSAEVTGIDQPLLYAFQE
jgi:hypothetical protein